MSTPPVSHSAPQGKDSRVAWIVFLVGCLAYLSAVAQRVSFGVASVEAAERFQVPATGLSLFTMMQVLVYAGLQVPVGVLVDRYGSRVLIVAGATAMAAGQFFLAGADSLTQGILGRVLVGAGDAATFVCVLRLLPAWFSATKIPVLTQLVAMFGNVGQLFSVLPFAFMLHAVGWVPSFAMLGGVATVCGVLALLLLRDAPAGVYVLNPSLSLRSVHGLVVESVREPGTRLAFFIHFTAQFVGNTFGLMWAYPYLQNAQGLTSSEVATVMSAFVAANVLISLGVGKLSAHFARHRTALVLCMSGVVFSGWALLLLWPGQAPYAVVFVGVGLMALSFPTSMVAFDVVRTFNPPQRGGTATGLVNVGGFAASLLAIWLVGLVLDLLYGAGISETLYDAEAFRPAMASQAIVAVIGAAGMLISAHQVRRRHGLKTV